MGPYSDSTGVLMYKKRKRNQRVQSLSEHGQRKSDMTPH